MALDLSPLYNTLMQRLYWIVPFLVLVTILRTSWFKGWIGELWVRLSAELRLPKNVYHAFHNVTLPTLDGTTQIDHVLLSVYGIFVIETKNMRGWIFGGEHQAKWTQKIYKKTLKFQNPLRQNYKHVKALESALELPIKAFHSVVAFVGDCEFKTPMPGQVTRGSGMITYIKSFRIPILDEEQVLEAVNRIESGRLTPSFETRRKHVALLNSRSDACSAQFCPKCGCEMVLRTAKKGRNAGRKFWGCSSFPGCKTVLELS